MRVSQIYDEILFMNERDSGRSKREKTYVITGRVGPTGKTWLTNKLKYEGFNACDISELMASSGGDYDGENHVSEKGNVVLITLNKLINTNQFNFIK